MTRPYEVEIKGSDQGAGAAFNKTKRSIEDIEGALRRSAKAGGDTAAVFKGMTVSRIAVDAIYRMKQALEDMVQSGIRYNAMMESSKLGIGSIVASQAMLLDQDGRLLTGREALNAAMRTAQTLMQQIEIRGLQTTATTEQLVEAFQGAVGPATAMGLTLDETQQVVLDIVQAAGALGVPMHQLNEEVRSILGGTINMHSRVAKALGLTNEMVKDWAEQNVLAKRLTDTLGTFRMAGQDTAKTWAGLTSNMAEAFAKLAGTATKRPFEDIKAAMDRVISSIIQVNDEGIKLGPAVQEAKEFVDDLWAGFKGLLAAVGNFVPWETVRDIVKEIGRTTRMIGEGWKALSETWVGTYVREGLKGIWDGWKHIGGLLGSGTAYLKEMEAAQNNVRTAVQATSAAVQDQATVIGKLGDDKIQAYRKAFEKAREFIEAEKAQVTKLEEQKVELARKSADLRIESSRKELDYKRRIADFDKSEKQLARELAILKGTGKPLTAQEEKKQRIADIEERITRLQEDRKRAAEDHTRETTKAATEAASLKKETEDVDKKWKDATAALATVQASLKESSQGALTFNDSLSKTVVTANELAKALMEAGRVINAYNAKLPERGPTTGQRFDYSKLEKELQAPMTRAAQAASDTQKKVESIKGEIPAATREVENQRKEWQRINAEADEHLKKIERIKYAVREWGFKMEGINPEAEGAYAPGY